jgi:hypothetical protein
MFSFCFSSGGLLWISHLVVVAHADKWHCCWIQHISKLNDDVSVEICLLILYNCVRQYIHTHTHTHSVTLTQTTCWWNEIFVIFLYRQSSLSKGMDLHFELNLTDSESILSDSTVNCCDTCQYGTTIHNLEIAHKILDDACGQMDRTISAVWIRFIVFPQISQKSALLYNPNFWIWRVVWVRLPTEQKTSCHEEKLTCYRGSFLGWRNARMRYAGTDFRFFREAWASSLPCRMKIDKRNRKSKLIFRSKVFWKCLGNDIDHW